MSKSNCHQKPLQTVHGGEGTSYYICSECQQPADPYVTQSSNPYSTGNHTTVDEILDELEPFEETNDIDEWHDAKKLAKAALLSHLLSRIANMKDMPSLPSDHPDMKFWQGYHEAQVDVTNLLTELFNPLKENKHE